VSDRTFSVRDEEAPSETTSPADVAAVLTAKGLFAVGTDLPAITLLTYTNLDLGYGPGVLWSTDLDTGEAYLNGISRSTASRSRSVSTSISTGSS